jgi:hypothetical protein
MKTIILILFSLLSGLHQIAAQDIIELDRYRNMCISGKGPGQDGAINPYYGSDSIAIVENLGEHPISIRIETIREELVRTIPLGSKKTKEVELLRGQVLYFDSKEKAKASVSFREK